MAYSFILVGSIIAGIVAVSSFLLWALNVFQKLGTFLLVLWIISAGIALLLGFYYEKDEMGYTLVYNNADGRVEQQIPLTECQKCIYKPKSEGLSCYCRDCGLFQ